MGTRVQEVDICGQRLVTGMEVSLPKSPGRRAGKYRFDWAETADNGDMVLTVFGPLRSRATPHYRLAAASIVKIVHAATSAP